MRVVIYGTGAIGGSVAAALSESGTEVVGISRGRQLAAIREGGFRLRHPGGEIHARFDCVGDPAEIAFREDDAILLCVKGQDTPDALRALARAGVRHQPVFCTQNGVANEREALRRFANVHGITVMMPATFLDPGEVIIHSEPKLGIFDVGLALGGHDAADMALVERLEAAGIAAFTCEDVMASKRGKLLVNLNNILEAALGRGAATGDLLARLKAEGEAAFRAAGLSWLDVGGGDPRREKFMRFADLPGVKRAGSSTTQSLMKGGTLETDFLNGEIALLGRLHGVPVPANAAMVALAAALSAEGAGPGARSLADLEALVAGFS